MVSWATRYQSTGLEHFPEHSGQDFSRGQWLGPLGEDYRTRPCTLSISANDPKLTFRIFVARGELRFGGRAAGYSPAWMALSSRKRIAPSLLLSAITKRSRPGTINDIIVLGQRIQTIVSQKLWKGSTWES